MDTLYNDAEHGKLKSVFEIELSYDNNEWSIKTLCSF
jgi:hypothetical protein